jgi:hypothetical protein
VLYEEDNKWYYMSNQENDEVAIFKNFDSKEDVAQCEHGSKSYSIFSIVNISFRCCTFFVQSRMPFYRKSSKREYRSSSDGLHVSGKCMMDSKRTILHTMIEREK